MPPLGILGHLSNEIAHFPGVVGIVNGTHIRIQKIEADHINRHFYHSINLQAIC